MASNGGVALAEYDALAYSDAIVGIAARDGDNGIARGCGGDFSIGAVAFPARRTTNSRGVSRVAVRPYARRPNRHGRRCPAVWVLFVAQCNGRSEDRFLGRGRRSGPSAAMSLRPKGFAGSLRPYAGTGRGAVRTRERVWG